jgi:hypothetical protein
MLKRFWCKNVFRHDNHVSLELRTRKVWARELHVGWQDGSVLVHSGVGRYDLKG